MRRAERARGIVHAVRRRGRAARSIFEGGDGAAGNETVSERAVRRRTGGARAHVVSRGRPRHAQIAKVGKGGGRGGRGGRGGGDEGEDGNGDGDDGNGDGDRPGDVDGPGDGLVPVPIVSGSDFGGRLESPEHSGSTFWYWSRCRACAETTSTISCRDASSSDGSWLACPAPPARGRVPLPAEAEETSLGRFFEFALSSGEAERARGLTSCGHALFTQRAHYFSANGVTACVAFDRVTPLRVVSPPSVVPRCATPNAIERDDACDDPAAAVARAMRTPEYAKQLERLAAASRLHDSATRGGESASTVSVFEKTGNATMTFEDARGVSFRVTAYHPVRFDALRRWAVEDGDAGFFASLAKCRPWETGSLGGEIARDVRQVGGRSVHREATQSRGTRRVPWASWAMYFRAMFAARRRRAESDGFGTCLAKMLGAFQVRARLRRGRRRDRRRRSDAPPSTRPPRDPSTIRILRRRLRSGPRRRKWRFEGCERVLEFIVMENVLRHATSGMTRGARSTSRDRFARGTRRARRRRRSSEPGAHARRDRSRGGVDRTRGRRRVARGFYWTRTSARIWRRTRRSWTRRPKPRSRRGLRRYGVPGERRGDGLLARRGRGRERRVGGWRRRLPPKVHVDKQLESYVKSAGGLGAGEREPTVVSRISTRNDFGAPSDDISSPCRAGLARERNATARNRRRRERLATAGLSPRDDGDD